MLIRFWVNHHLLDVFQRPRWRVVKGRSREYVKKVAAGEYHISLIFFSLYFMAPSVFHWFYFSAPSFPHRKALLITAI